MTTSVQLTGPELIKWLTEKQAEAAAHDKACYTEHLAAEKAWHKEAQTRLRAAAKMNRQDLQEHLRDGFNGMEMRLPSAPNCPVSQADAYTPVIEAISRDKRKTFTVGPTGGHRYVHRLLFADYSGQPKDMCG